MEFDAAIRELRTRMATQHLKVRTAFRALDRDCSGVLEKEELLVLLKNYHIKLADDDESAPVQVLEVLLDLIYLVLVENVLIRIVQRKDLIIVIRFNMCCLALQLHIIFTIACNILSSMLTFGVRWLY